MWLTNEIKVSECNYWEHPEIIDFLIGITANEFGFNEWKDYFEKKLVKKYQEGNNKFWLVTDLQDQLIATCGALQESEKVVKMNCFYVDKEYRKKGIGKVLYDLFIDFVKKENYESIILCTFKEFGDAIDFYKKRGFELYKVDADEFWYKKDV